MKAITLLATLKKSEQSNTEVLASFFAERLQSAGIEHEMVKLVDHTVLPGTYSNMGDGDAWPQILDKILAADIILFATPIWWGSHSSELQRVIERLDELHDEILQGNTSRIDGKVAGIIVTGDSDGAEHVIGTIANFCNAVGLILPPYATLTVLSKLQDKQAKTSVEELRAEYEKEYGATADKMVQQLQKFTIL